MKKREQNDFALLHRAASLCRTLSDALADGASAESASGEEGRRLYAATLTRLEREFVPPMERRDLTAIAERLAETSEALVAAAQTLHRTPRTVQTEGLVLPAARLKACGAALEALIAGLPQIAKVGRPIGALEELRKAVRSAEAEIDQSINALATSAASAGTLIARYAALSSIRRAAQAFAAAAETVAAAAVNNG
ncbi:MAG: hypothetical protein IKU55_01290 [Clostridia bacterium]|nr:hypothetical protein [Clostridia bacterium]